MLWQPGRSPGDVADEAFFVRCDDENNPPAERANGRLLAEVGVAPSMPFEFVVLRVGRDGGTASRSSRLDAERVGRCADGRARCGRACGSIRC